MVVAGLLVAGFLGTNIVSFAYSRNALKETILHNELPLTSSNIYSEIQADLLRPVFVSSLMSHDTFVRDWLLDGEKDVTRITRYLDEVRMRYNVFTAFLVSDRTGSYYHFTGRTKFISDIDSRDAWFFRVKAMKEPYEINIDYDQAQGDAVTIFVNYRVLDYQGNFIGAIGVGLKLDSVSNVVTRYSKDFHRTIYFVDETGHITVHSSNFPIASDNIFDAPGISAIADDILKKDDGYFEYVRDGETILLTTRLIPELKWRVIVEQPESEVIKGLWHGFLANIAIGLLIIVITVGAIAYTINIYQKQLELMASIDKLTGVANRQAFDAAFAYAITLQRRVHGLLSVILFDIDHFKQVNDRFGHLKGDKALQKVVKVIQSELRESDLCCRWGGEEIIVLLNGCSLARAIAIADGIRSTLAEEPIFEPDDGVRLTISAGVTEVVVGDDPAAVVSRADAALYRAKADGRNRISAEPPPLPQSVP